MSFRLAAGLLRRRLDERFGPSASLIEISSAGTHALLGAPMDPPAAELLEELGGSVDDTVARQLDATLLRKSQLVLTMTREHRDRAVGLFPGALRRTYTLPELARVARVAGPIQSADPASALRLLLERAPVLRGPTAPADPPMAMWPIPTACRRKEYRRAGERIENAVEGVLSLV